MIIYQILLSFTALFFGSLTGVLVKRIPEDEDFVLSRSKCPHCSYQLKWYENIPLVSYVILLAKCSNCKGKISSFYPLVEIGFLICATPFINLAVKRFSVLNSFPDQIFILLDFLFYMVFLSIALALGLIDQKMKLLPHKLTYSGIVIGIIYVSLFSSPYYNPAEGLSDLLSFLPGFLLSSFSAIKQFAIVVFCLDLFVFFVNLLAFKENALLETSQALTFGQKKLQENTKLVYLVYLILVLFLIYFNLNIVLEILFIAIGISYLVFEIIPFFKLKKEEQGSTPDLSKKTILGGGDIMMLGFFATILGFQKCSFVLLSSFYVAFIFLLLKIIAAYYNFQFELKKEINPIQDNSFDIKALLRGTIPLGLALAISFIAVMMMLAK